MAYMLIIVSIACLALAYIQYVQVRYLRELEDRLRALEIRQKDALSHPLGVAQ